MSSFSKIPSVVKGFFSRGKTKSQGTNYSDRFEDHCTPARTIKAAVHQHLDGVRPESKRIASLLPRLASVIEKKLKPQGGKLDVAGEAGEAISARRTCFGRIFRHSASEQFNVVLQNGQTVTRSRSEVKTHVLLQSYLKTQHGDASVSEGEVVHPNDFIKQSHGAERARGNAVSGWNVRDWAHRERADSIESHMLLLTPEELESGSQSDDESPTRDGEISGSPWRPGSRSNPGLVAEGARAAATSAASNRSRAVVPIPSIPPPSDGQLTVPQARTVRFIEDRLQLSPLEFLDEISREDPLVAAFLATQTAKMLTKVGPAVPTQSLFAQSAHPDLHVMEVEHCGPTERPSVRFKDPEKQAAAQLKAGNGTVLLLALLDDLKQEIARQNQRKEDSPNDFNGDERAVLPEGIRTFTTDIPINAIGDSGQNSVAACAQHVLALLSEQIEISQNLAARITGIASVSPAAAAFCGVADEMLLIKGGGTAQAAGKRFPYLNSGDFGDLTPVESDDGRRWYETFLPGVQRTRDNAVGASVWRILEGNEWKEGQSKNQVMAHVAKEALRHITKQGAAPLEQAIYPLVVYELLAKAANATVPQYLKDAEQRAHDNVMQRRTQASANRQRIATLQEAAATEREMRAQKDALDFARERVANRHQLRLTYGPIDPKKVTHGSIDVAFTLSPRTGTALDMIRGIQENRLSMTHARQAISSRVAPGSAVNNRCWLRSSWLSLLSSASPDVLAESYQAMCKQSDPRVPGTSRILKGIASRFKANPAAFLHSAGNGQTADRIGAAAFLEHGMLADGSGKAPASGPGHLKTTENALESIQIDVASCFRFENPSIMRELDGASMGAQASSDLPVTLHRAFNAPALIIEAGKRGTNESGVSDVIGAQIRVVAPPGSVLARFIEEAARNNQPINEGSTVLDELLTRFTDLPIIWLEEGHYETYLPNKFFSA